MALTPDFLAPFDPTAYTNISGAQLLQMISGATPYTDRGIVIRTYDTGLIPNPPDAVTYPKLKAYLWLRQSTTSATLYNWVDGAGTNYVNTTSILQWYPASASAIGAGSINGYQIASNTIQDSNIIALNWSKLTGVPTGLISTGSAAGGVLTGTYPNPSIGNAQVTGSMIALTTITHANLAANAVQPTTDILASGSAYQMLRTNASATALEYIATPTTLVAQASLETNLAANPLKPIRANAAGNGYEYAGHTILQVTTFSTASIFDTSTVCSSGTAPTTSNTTLVTVLGASGDMIITPLSATSTLLIEFSGQFGNATAVNGGYHIFEGNTVKASGLFSSTSVGNSGSLSFTLAGVSTAARTFRLRLAPCSAGHFYLNADNTGIAVWGGGLAYSTVKITEYL